MRSRFRLLAVAFVLVTLAGCGLTESARSAPSDTTFRNEFSCCELPYHVAPGSEPDYDPGCAATRVVFGLLTGE